MVVGPVFMMIGKNQPLFIPQLGTFNQIKIVAQGTLFSFYVNDQLLAQAQDEMYSIGNIAPFCKAPLARQACKLPLTMYE